MSSTNRGYDRHKSDYYITPIPAIKEFLKEFVKDELVGMSVYGVLDPCAGGDKDNPMSYPEAIKSFSKIRVDTIDIREDSLAETKGDYLTMDIETKPFVIITNPPFHIAKEIIEKALTDTKEGGYVIMLLRLNFWGSKARREFLTNNMPKYCYVHSKRMSFTKEGGTDSIEYAHFVWKVGDKPKFCLTKLI